MANPQKENGYVPIANEIFEALAQIRISGEAWQVLSVILRKTYGFNKKEDAISLSQFVLSTGMSKTRVCQAVKKLTSMNIITKKGKGVANIYRLNKDFDKWIALPKKVTLPKKEIKISEKGKNHYQKRDIQKTVSKDTITKDIHTDFPEAEIEIIGEPQEITESPPVSPSLITLAESFRGVNRGWKRMLDDPEEIMAGNELLEHHDLDYLLKITTALPKTNEVRYMPVVTKLSELRDKITKWELQLKKIVKDLDKNEILI